MQIHGGYGYSSEYLPEAWLRDQKLNSIHEGTTGIQSLDLLGRKVVADGGARSRSSSRRCGAAIGASARRRRRRASCAIGWRDAAPWSAPRRRRWPRAASAGDVDGMMLHCADYLELFSIVVVGWQWILQAAVAAEALAARREPARLLRGQARRRRYWIATELPRAAVLAELCRSGEDSYARMRAEWF